MSLTCKRSIEGNKGKSKGRFGTGQRSRHTWPKPLCCDSIMEISSFPHSQRSLTVWVPVFTFRGEHLVSPQNTWRNWIHTEQHFCFPAALLLFWNRVHPAHSIILMLRICREAFRDQCVYTNEFFFFPPPQLGFLHDLVNATIKLIWFSSLCKILDKIQCLNTPTQSLMQHHHQLNPDLNIEGCPVSEITPILVLFARSSSCRCNHTK